jgi:hypothetical protein
MAVTETDRLIDARSADPIDHPVEPARNLRSRFATGNLTVPDRPARNRLPDLLAGLALIIAVEPLGKVVVDLRFVFANEPSQLRSLAGSSPWAAEYQLEVLRQEVALQGAGQPLAGLGERQVGDGGVPARPTPFSFAMADQKQTRRHAVHRIALDRL